MDALLAFAATLLALRLSADLVRRHREQAAPGLLAWAAALAAFAAGSAAIAWGSAYEWGNPAFRVYYLFGGLLAAALLGVGSLQRVGVRWITPLTLVYVGLAIGIAIAVPLTDPVTGSSIPEAQAHLAFFPARLVAILANSAGTLAAVVVAAMGLRRRPLGNGLILAGLVVAAVGSALAGLGEAESSVFTAAAVVLLYAGFVIPRPASSRAPDGRATDSIPGPAGAAP
jgi:hypothetical protein